MEKKSEIHKDALYETKEEVKGVPFISYKNYGRLYEC
jgi:hypothetical protein